MTLILFQGYFKSVFVPQDETLFGPPARLSQMTGNRSWGSSSTPSVSTSDGVKTRGQRVSNDPEVIQVISKDLIRKIK